MLLIELTDSYRAPFRAVCIEKKTHFRLWLSHTDTCLDWLSKAFQLQIYWSFDFPVKKKKSVTSNTFMRHSVKLMFPDVLQLVKMPSLTFKSQIFQPYLKSEEHISTPLLINWLEPQCRCMLVEVILIYGRSWIWLSPRLHQLPIFALFPQYDGHPWGQRPGLCSDDLDPGWYGGSWRVLALQVH